MEGKKVCSSPSSTNSSILKTDDHSGLMHRAFGHGKIFHISKRLHWVTHSTKSEIVARIQENSHHFYFSNHIPQVRGRPIGFRIVLR